MEVIPDESELSITRSEEPRTAADRHLKRIARLRSLLAADGRSIDQQVGLARYSLWQKQQPANIRLRPAFVLRDDRRGTAPIRAISASKSAAVQLLLMALFENQCRSQGRDSERTPVPLARPTGETETAWLYLLALPTVDRRDRRTRGSVGKHEPTHSDKERARAPRRIRQDRAASAIWNPRPIRAFSGTK